MHNRHHQTFFQFGFFFFSLKMHKKKVPLLKLGAGRKCCDETLSTIMGANHFCRVLCVYVVIIPTSKVPLISLFNVVTCFLRCVFSIQMQYNIKSAIYMHIETAYTSLLGLGLEIAAVSLFSFFFFSLFMPVSEFLSPAFAPSHSMCSVI